MTEMREHGHTDQLAFGSRDYPVIAILGSDDNLGGIVETILRAKDNDYHVFVYCTDRSSEVAKFARQLGATVFESQSDTEFKNQTSSDAREHGFSGVVLFDTPGDRLDFERSRSALYDSTDYVISGKIRQNNKSNLIVGIPTYNEEVAIGSVVIAAKSIANEVIVVDDGSSDNTTQLAEKAGATVIEHEENRGKGAAIQTLLESVKNREFGAFVLLDGDGQHNPEEIPLVAEPIIENEADLVIGSRYLQESSGDETPAYRRVGQKVLDVLTIGSSSTHVTDSQSGFRAFSPRAIEELAISTDGFGVETEMIDDGSNKDLQIKEQPIEVRYDDIDGQSQNPFRHGLSVVLFLVQLIRDKHPLAFFGLPGLIFVFGGFLYGLDGYFLYQNTGVFLPVKALGSGFLVVLGMLCIFAGLILNSVSNMLK